MRQFDLLENPSTFSRANAPYFVVLQSHHLENLDSVVVAPVLRDAARSMTALDVNVEVAGEPLVVALGEIFAMDRALLKAAVGSLAGHEDQLRRAVERLFSGF